MSHVYVRWWRRKQAQSAIYASRLEWIAAVFSRYVSSGTWSVFLLIVIFILCEVVIRKLKKNDVDIHKFFLISWLDKG